MENLVRFYNDLLVWIGCTGETLRIGDLKIPDDGLPYIADFFVVSDRSRYTLTMEQLMSNSASGHSTKVFNASGLALTKLGADALLNALKRFYVPDKNARAQWFIKGTHGQDVPFQDAVKIKPTETTRTELKGLLDEILLNNTRLKIRLFSDGHVQIQTYASEHVLYILVKEKECS